MSSHPIRSLMITNLGRACGRVRRNIDDYRPTTVMCFHQANPDWNEENKDYAKALNRFETHPLIQKYDKRRRISPVEVNSITNYTQLFDTLTDLIEDNKEKYGVIFLDVTGLPKLATVVALHLAGMHDNVLPIYNRNKVVTRFDEKRDAEYSTDDGHGPEVLPFTKIDTSWINNPESSECQVLVAAYRLVEESKEKLDARFSEKDLEIKLEQLDDALTPKKLGKRSFGIKLGKAIKKMRDSGLLTEDFQFPRRLRLSLPGYALARRIS